MSLGNEDILRQMRGQAANTIRQQGRQPLVPQRNYVPTTVNEMPDVARQTVQAATNELVRRGFDISAWQKQNVRNLTRRENNFDEGATPEQRARVRQLERIEPRPGTRIARTTGRGRGPGVGNGRRHHINSGRPKGS